MKRIDEEVPFKVDKRYLLREARHFQDHKKGIPEWIKNADDSYIRHETRQDVSLDKARIILNLHKGEVTCLDFGGGDFDKITEHLFHWGNEESARQGLDLKGKSVSGGHGNGGKYYALGQFKKCRILNYYDGKLSIWILEHDETGQRGFRQYVEVREEPVSFKEAAQEAGFYDWDYFHKYEKGVLLFQSMFGTGFFCWQGLKPQDEKVLTNKRSLYRLLNSLQSNQQARPALQSRYVQVLFKGDLFYEQLEPELPKLDESFGIREFALPNRLGEYEFNKTIKSDLLVGLSPDPLTGDNSTLNRIEIMARGRPIASYSIPELVVDKGIAKSLFAQIDAPELKEEYGCVTNDRVELADNEATNEFVGWCRNRLLEVLSEIQGRETRKQQKKQFTALRNFLDDVQKEISDYLDEDLITATYDPKGPSTNTVDAPSDDPGFGADGTVKQKGGGRRRGGLKSQEAPSKPRKNRSQVRILLSGFDKDPLNPDQTYDMIERQQILHQRVDDVEHGIWWLNTEKQYFRELKLEKNPAVSKLFILFLTKDIVLSHRTRRRFKESERYDPDGIEELNFDLIDGIFGKVVDRLGVELSVEESVPNQIRDAIRGRERFTARDIAEETGIDAQTVSLFLTNPHNALERTYRIEKQRGGGPGGNAEVNVYIAR